MKRILILCIIVMTSFAYAEYVEVKRVDGARGTYNNYSSPLYVCYTERIKVVSHGEMYLSYRGCTREYDRCSYYGKAHFGKYPNNYQASRALRRCQTSRPRFVD
jgi:hypothetical protein